jgi:HK97 family phage major capsid protein
MHINQDGTCKICDERAVGNLAQIEERLALIKSEVETRADMSAETLKLINERVDALKTEAAALVSGNETRAALLASIAAGTEPGATVIRTFPTPATPTPAQNEVRSPSATDIHDTPEYRNAFMEHVCRGTPIPLEFRANQVTTSSDAGAVIPTTTLQEIIKKLSSYGSIYAKVRKLNIQGGVNVPILTLKPTAKWVGESKSDDQKIKADKQITFSYYGLECKIAQTLLASIVTYEMFQREFVQLSVEAIIETLEKCIFTGTGDGQMLGILKDSRVPTVNVITMTVANFKKWDEWKKQVFAKMKKSYRNGIFVMAQGTFDGYIDGMVDTTGQPIGRVNYGIADGEVYRFGGKTVETVEDDVITGFDEAASGDVVAVFFDPKDYAINSNMQLTVVKWVDHDDNKVKNKAIMICDGKLLDPNGVLIIKKGAAGS